MFANGGGMASKGLRVISCQVTLEDEAGYNPSHSTETLIGYTACYQLFNFAFSIKDYLLFTFFILFKSV